MPVTATITAIELPTAETIAALFREHDVLPWQTVYLSLPHDLLAHAKKCAACAIGILLVEARGSAFRARSHCRQSDLTVKEALEAETELPAAFVDGLDRGFTKSTNGKTWEEGLADVTRWSDEDIDPLYIEGFRVGWQAWELATAGEGPPEESP